jgi:putative transposase
MGRNDMKYKYRNQQFWCRGYYVDTVEKDEKKITSYIQEQLKEDEMVEQLTLDIEELVYG